MGNWITKATALGGMALMLAAIAPAPARAETSPKVRGVVERLPDTPDLFGEWLIDGHTVVVDRQTRLRARATRGRANDGHWTQAATGVVVRAPAWSPDAAHAAGFRPAIEDEVRGFGVGRAVRARVLPNEAGDWRAVDIELHGR